MGTRRLRYDPYVPQFLRLKGSVLPHVIFQTIVVTLVTTVVVILFELTDIKLSVSKAPPASVSNIFTQIIGIVVGLLLTYRTNTAYDRYWEGRKLWSTMVVQIRNFTRYIWIGVREDGRKKDDKQHEPSAKPEIVIEKRTALNLILGFSIAVKHYLREEPGHNHEDLENLISNIQSNLPGFKSTTIGESYTNQEKKSAWYSRLFRRKLKPHERNKAEYHIEDQNLPLDITLYLSSYVDTQFKNGTIDIPLNSQLLATLNGLCDCLSQFERILRSPIPLAYSIHLSQTVWIYCLSLPFFLVSGSRWATIVVVFFVSLVLFGLERIGTEIENPFGYDENDLDLDEFCTHIKHELDTISSHAPPTISDWVYTPENLPFENKEVNALDVADLDVDDVRSLLSVGSNPEIGKNSLDIQEGEGETPVKKENNLTVDVDK